MKTDNVYLLFEGRRNMTGRSPKRRELEGLCNAIIVKACNDYRRAIRRGNAEVKEEVLAFFRSSWFGMLTDASPDYIIKLLDEEYKEEKERKAKK